MASGNDDGVELRFKYYANLANKRSATTWQADINCPPDRVYVVVDGFAPLTTEPEFNEWGEIAP